MPELAQKCKKCYFQENSAPYLWGLTWLFSLSIGRKKLLPRRSKVKVIEIAFIIKDLFFNEINLLTEDINKETGLYMISLIAQLKDN